MKKLILGLFVGCAVCVGVNAGSYNRSSLITGANLILSNNATITYSDTNVVYWNWSYFPPVSINGITNPAVPPAWVYSGTSNFFALTNYINGGYVTNAFMTNTVNTIYPGWQRDVIAPDNALGDPGSAALVVSTRNLPTGTNLITFTLVRTDGTNSFLGNARTPTESFAFTCAGTGVTNSWFRTNIPTSFAFGGGKIRLHSVLTGNSSENTNSIIDNCYIEWNQP